MSIFTANENCLILGVQSGCVSANWEDFLLHIVKERRVKAFKEQGEEKGEDEEWYLLGVWKGLIANNVQHDVNCKYPK